MSVDRPDPTRVIDERLPLRAHLPSVAAQRGGITWPERTDFSGDPPPLLFRLRRWANRKLERLAHRLDPNIDHEDEDW